MRKTLARSGSLAICVLSLMLSQQAQGASDGPAKGPLTAAENAQCQAQRAEFNQGAQAYNAKLDELKALEAEFKALGAELEKDRAAVDRTDSAAMQALNAKIDRSNELAERYGQTGALLKAMASENKERAAQFRQGCENRTVALPPPAQAQPSAAVCGSSDGAKSVERQIEAAFAEMRADEKQRQAEVDRVQQARAKAQAWSDEKRGKIWLDILASPRFAAFEREKRPYVQELMRVLGSKPRNRQEECRLIQRIAAMLPAIKAINARQYGFMADEIRMAK